MSSHAECHCHEVNKFAVGCAEERSASAVNDALRSSAHPTCYFNLVAVGQSVEAILVVYLFHVILSHFTLIFSHALKHENSNRYKQK